MWYELNQLCTVKLTRLVKISIDSHRILKRFSTRLQRWDKAISNALRHMVEMDPLELRPKNPKPSLYP